MSKMKDRGKEPRTVRVWRAEERNAKAKRRIVRERSVGLMNDSPKIAYFYEL